MALLTEEYLKQYFKAKMSLDVVNEAIVILYKGEVSKEVAGVFKSKLQGATTQVAKYEKDILKKMNVPCISIGEGNWRIVRVKSSSSKSRYKGVLRVVPIREDHIHLITNCNNGVESMVQGLIEVKDEEEYKDIVYDQALALVGEYKAGEGVQPLEGGEVHEETVKEVVEEPVIVGEGTVSVSFHACKRYAQRMLGIGDRMAEQYTSEHDLELRKEVAERYRASQLLWTDREGAQYWFDDNNTIYIVLNNNIVTLYEKDFGFNKTINKNIVLSQLDVIKEAYEELSGVEADLKRTTKELEPTIRGYDEEIKHLKDQITNLESRKRLAQAGLEELNSRVQSVLSKCVMESNKLFFRK